MFLFGLETRVGNKIHLHIQNYVNQYYPLMNTFHNLIYNLVSFYTTRAESLFTYIMFNVYLKHMGFSTEIIAQRIAFQILF